MSKGPLLGVTNDVGGTPATPPVITVTVSSLSFGNLRPGDFSASQNYNVSGTGLGTNPIIITAPAGFIINTNNSNTNQSPISLSPTAGTVSATTIYVKFNPSAVQVYSDVIQNTAVGAVTQNINVSGEGKAPVITIPVTPLNFDPTIIGAYSVAQTYNVSGQFLSANLTITAPAGFIINQDGSNTNSSPIVLTQSGGTVGSTTIYVKFHPTIAQVYDDFITHSSTGATTKNLEVIGHGSTPSITASTASITGLDYMQGSGPSAASSTFSITAIDMVPAIGNVTVTPSADIEIYDGTSWQSSAFLIPYTSGYLGTGSIYQVRLKAGLTQNTYNETVTISGGGATPYVISVSGTVSAPATITVSTTALTFGNIEIFQYATYQTYTVGGTGLVSNIVVTAPTGFIINQDNSNNNASPISLVPVSGTVNATTIYVKIYPTAIQSYSGDITHVSTGATTKTVALTASGVNEVIHAKSTGVVIRDGDYLVHEITADGTIYFEYTPSGVTFDRVIAGGGAGGGCGTANGAASGGGGAGQYRVAVESPIAMPYTIFIGAAGAGGVSGVGGNNGSSGGNSYFNGVTCVGGGGGGGQLVGVDGGNGGGGGGTTSDKAGGTGLDFNGGTSEANSLPFCGGGGGGSSQNGFGGTGGANQGRGGAGTASSITGVAVVYAAGGGGGCFVGSTPGVGGSSGAGGGGGADHTAGSNGVTYGSGGGGGGSPGSGTPGPGGNGKQGVVYVRYYSPGTPDVTAYKYSMSLLNGSAEFTANDSSKLVNFQGALWMFMGWNGGANIKEVWKSTDGGNHWTQQADIPWVARHYFGVNVVGNLIYLYGGDGMTDMYSFDGTTYTLITNSLAIGTRFIPTTGTDGTFLYLAGGQSDLSAGATAYTNMYKITTAGAVTDMGNIGAMTVFSAGGLEYQNGYLIAWSGGTQAGGTTNNKCYKSNNQGSSWTLVSTIPTAIADCFVTCFQWDNRLWTIPKNGPFVFYSGDGGANWLEAPATTISTHAAAVAENDDGDLIVAGGTSVGVDNDVWKLTKITI